VNSSGALSAAAAPSPPSPPHAHAEGSNDDDGDKGAQRTERLRVVRARQAAIFQRIEALEYETHASLTAGGRNKSRARRGGRGGGGSGTNANTGKSKRSRGATRGRDKGNARGGAPPSDSGVDGSLSMDSAHRLGATQPFGGSGGGDGQRPQAEDDDPVGVAGGPEVRYTRMRGGDDADPDSDAFWEDTVSWLHTEMLTMSIAKDHPDILAEAVVILSKWRDTFPKSVWVRVVKSGRIAKELNEIAPVIFHTRMQLDKIGVPTNPDERANIVDLCSGFGYMGMFLAEMLDPAKVQNIVLVDKQWPMFNQRKVTQNPKPKTQNPKP
jgi:hypothetical protein